MRHIMATRRDTLFHVSNGVRKDENIVTKLLCNEIANCKSANFGRDAKW